jgi:CHAD domain-containing protein
MVKFLTPRWDPEASPAVNARRELPRLVTEYFAFGRELVAKEPRAADLHALRLATKRFRYTLELLRTFHGPALEKRLKALQKAQQLLGDVNDHVAIAALLPPNARARRKLLSKAEELATEFQAWWRDEFDAPGQESAWKAYLARGARDEAVK